MDLILKHFRKKIPRTCLSEANFWNFLAITEIGG